MNMQPHHWRQDLEQLFSATVNQQTLEEAADTMVLVSASDQSYHVECLNAIDQGIAAAECGDDLVIDSINKSGYQVNNSGAAVNLLRDLREIYIDAYERARSM